MAKAKEDLDSNKLYNIAEAIDLLKKSSSMLKFDPSIEISIKVGLDLKKISSGIRGMVSLPAGTGKNTVVAVICRTDDKIEEAKKAGADIVGGQDVIEDIKSGNTSFDVCIATPDMMGSIGPIARILGPKGLMPNPKLGTVTFEMEKTIKQFKAGRVEFKMDKFGYINVKTGKASFSTKDIEENIVALIKEINNIRPENAKGKYLENCRISYTMGPSVLIAAI